MIHPIGIMPGRIPPTTWGPFFWHTIHIVALGYPKEPTYAEKRAAKEFYESLTNLIPCPICRIHYAEHLKEMPVSPSLDTREDLFRWTVVIHNKVNKDLGKPEVSELEAITFYHKLGELDRSPVWTPADMEAYQFASAVKMGGAIVGAAAVFGGLYYYLTRKD